MNLNRITGLAVSTVLLAPCALSALRGQDTSLKDLLATKSIPPTIKIGEIPADFYAVELSSGGGGGNGPLGDIYGGGGLGMLMLMGASMGHGGAGDPNQAKLMRAMSMAQITWTRGDSMRVDGKAFTVAYKINCDLSLLAGGQPQFPDALSLNLIATEGLTNIEPRPDVTRESFASAFKGLSTAAVDSPTATQDLKANQIATVSNFKQATLGMIMYMGDYDDVLPYAQDSKTAYFVTQPYIKNRNVMSTRNPNGGIMRMNLAVAGVSATSIAEPAMTPLYYDSEPWPDGGRCVGYCDGHAKYEPAARWSAIQPYLRLKLMRVAKPLPAGYGLQWDKNRGNRSDTVERVRSSPARDGTHP